ncbi:hypothetical protein B8049_20390 [Klebsiella pneumoniae]|nr:hypothetical protein B8049_20390 [Klebsiella pneumoniae]
MGTPHIGMVEGQGSLGRRLGLAIQPMLENGRHRLVGSGIDRPCPGAGRFQSLPSDLACQTQDAEAGPIGLLWMRPGIHQMLDEDGGLRSNLGGPLQNPGRIPARHGLVRRRHVGIDRGVPALVAAPDMAGDACALVEGV